MKNDKQNKKKEMQSLSIEDEVRQLFDTNNQQNIALNKLVEAINIQKNVDYKIQTDKHLIENAFRKKVWSIMNIVLKRK